MGYLYGIAGILVATGIAFAGAFFVHKAKEARYNIEVHKTEKTAIKVIDNIQKKEEKGEPVKDKDLDCVLSFDPC